MFPNRINVQFLGIIDKSNIKIEIWECGAEYTLASGSSSVGAAFAARILGLADESLSVHMPRGVIEIDFTPDGHVHMTGAVESVCQEVYVLPQSVKLKKYIGLMNSTLPDSQLK